MNNPPRTSAQVRSRNRPRQSSRLRIVDDFAVMPRLSSRAFDPRREQVDLTRFEQTPQDLNRSFAENAVRYLRQRFGDDYESSAVISVDRLSDERSEVDEFELYQPPDLPIPKDLRAKTPPGGFHGQHFGMRRCDYCKSWNHPKYLVNDRCDFCRKDKKQSKEPRVHV